MNWIEVLNKEPSDTIKACMLFFLARTAEGEMTAIMVRDRVMGGQEFWSALKQEG